MLLTANSLFADVVCTQDLNDDGASDSPGESATCLTTGSDYLCPISSTACIDNPPVCQLDSALACSPSNTCSRGGSCVAGEYETKIIYKIPNAAGEYSFQTSFNKVTYMKIVGGSTYCQPMPMKNWGWFNTNWIAANEASCSGVFEITGLHNGFQCSQDNEFHFDKSACESACTETGICTKQSYTCPVGPYACQNNSGNMECSPNVCTDLETTPPEVLPTDTRMLRDDGARGVDGSCLAEINIFAGRPMDCKLEGVGSAFQNCCSKGDAIMQDNIAGYQEAELAVDAISAIAVASYDAYVAYTAYTTAGLAGEAATAGMLAFENAMIAAGPTMIYAAAAIVVINYVANACTQGDMETSTADASGMCSYIGKRCTEKWAGECVQKVRMFCCFNTKLGRIIHEQGRPQLKAFSTFTGGIFGSPTNPECRGFKPAEFQALDFSQIDMSEYYSELSDAAASTIKINDTISTNINGKFNAIP